MKRVKIISDFPLLIQAIMATCLVVVGCSWMIWLVGIDGVAKNKSEILPIQVIFAAVMVGFVVAVFSVSSRIFSIITLSKEAISLWVPFKARKTYSYKQFPYVYWGKYYHGNIAGFGRWMWYVVFSTNKLSTSELNQINKLSNSKDLFKIKYSKKNMRCFVQFFHRTIAIN